MPESEKLRTTSEWPPVFHFEQFSAPDFSCPRLRKRFSEDLAKKELEIDKTWTALVAAVLAAKPRRGYHAQWEEPLIGEREMTQRLEKLITDLRTRSQEAFESIDKALGELGGEVRALGERMVSVESSSQRVETQINESIRLSKEIKQDREDLKNHFDGVEKRLKGEVSAVKGEVLNMKQEVLKDQKDQFDRTVKLYTNLDTKVGGFEEKIDQAKATVCWFGGGIIVTVIIGFIAVIST